MNNYHSVRGLGDEANNNDVRIIRAHALRLTYQNINLSSG